MVQKYDIYIGSDNGSQRITDDYLSKITGWANYSLPEGYTMLYGKGYWNGNSEDCLILDTMMDYENGLLKNLKNLKDELEQKSILISKYNVDTEII